MDFQVANWFYHSFGNSKAVLTIAKILTHLGDAWAFVIIIAGLLIFKKIRKLGLYSLATVLITFCFNEFVLKNIIDRARPYESHPEFLSVVELAKYSLPSGSSMPSGHSTVTMCLAVCVFMFNKKIGIGAICVSVLVGITRMILCVHYLTDVLVGFVIGIAFAIAVHYLMNLIYKKLERKDLKNEKNCVSEQ